MEILENNPRSYEALMSFHLWHNSMLGTTFDADLSKSGFNYICDLHQRTELSEETTAFYKQRILLKVKRLKNSLTLFLKKTLESKSYTKTVVIHPYQTINFKNEDKLVCRMSSKEYYEILIGPKISMPHG